MPNSGDAVTRVPSPSFKTDKQFFRGLVPKIRPGACVGEHPAKLDVMKEFLSVGGVRKVTRALPSSGLFYMGPIFEVSCKIKPAETGPAATRAMDDSRPCVSGRFLECTQV